MKVFAVNGSVKGERGITYWIYSEFIEGLREAGAEVHSINLVDENISGCKACMCCWSVKMGTCVLKDNMAEYIKEMTEADLIVFESPVYLNSVSSLLKNFIERCMPFNNRTFRVGPKGNYLHSMNYKLPPVLVISSCGLPGDEYFRALDEFFEMLAEGWDTKIVGKIYRNESYLFQDYIEEIKIIQKDYFRRLKKAAAEVVETGQLSERTQRRLNSLLLTKELYRESGEGWRWRVG